MVDFLKKKNKSVDAFNADDKIETFPTDADAYDIIGQVGKGAFASVYKGLCKEKDQEVALKVIELEKDDLSDDKDKGQSSTNWEEIQKEAAIMRRMHHPNIVSCFAAFTVGTQLWLVLPYLKGGSAADIMKSMKEFKHGFKDESIIATIINDVLNGINYCHNDGRIHRDIKAANILLSADGVAQLSDFGVSGAIIEDGLRKNGRHTFTGSLWWMAPEVLQRENKHSFPADIWSLGITALELAYGKPPHASQRPVKVMLTILQSPAPTFDLYEKEDPKEQAKVKWSKDFKKFLHLCLQKESDKRASSKDLLKHSWFKHVKDHSYIVQHVLNNAPDLPVNANKPHPIQQENTLDADDNEEKGQSIRFSFGTEATSQVLKVHSNKDKKKDTTDGNDLSSLPETIEIGNSPKNQNANANDNNNNNNNNINNNNGNVSTNNENNNLANDTPNTKIKVENIDENDNENTGGTGRFDVSEDSVSHSMPQSDVENDNDNDNDNGNDNSNGNGNDNDATGDDKPSRFNVSYDDEDD